MASTDSGDDTKLRCASHPPIHQGQRKETKGDPRVCAAAGKEKRCEEHIKERRCEVHRNENMKSIETTDREKGEYDTWM